MTSTISLNRCIDPEPAMPDDGSTPSPTVPAPQAVPDLPVAFRFAVSFGATARDADASFAEVSGISPEIELETVVDSGENHFAHRLPKGERHPHLVLERGIAKFESALVTWCRDVLEGALAAPLATKLMHVSLLDHSGSVLRLWSFEDAFPVKWEVEPFNGQRNALAMKKVEFGYRSVKREI